MRAGVFANHPTVHRGAQRCRATDQPEPAPVLERREAGQRWLRLEKGGAVVASEVDNTLSIYHASVNIRCSARVAQEIDPCLKSSPAR